MLKLSLYGKKTCFIEAAKISLDMNDKYKDEKVLISNTLCLVNDASTI